MKFQFLNKSYSQDHFFTNILSLPFPLRLLGFTATLLLAISTFFIGVKVIDKYLFISVPTEGGMLREGVVGRPRFINPVIAKTEVDRDLTALIYSGLFRPSHDGLEEDIADGVEVSEDAKTYTVSLNKKATFHDGTKLTSKDVLFTVERIQNKGIPIKSPLAPNFVGVTVSAPDDHTVVFTLEKPHTSFKEALTFGILPKHIWEPVSISDFDQTNYNLEPIGSGPYKIDSIVKDTKRGLAKEYDLQSFREYVHGQPLIPEFHLVFYGSDDDRTIAFNDGEISQLPSAPTSLARRIADGGRVVISSPMPRIFGVYLNELRVPLFEDAVVRSALNLTIPREKIISEIFADFAEKETGPFPGIIKEDLGPYDARVLEAEVLLEKQGWKKDSDGIYVKTDKKTKKEQRIAFSISLPDIPELLNSAKIIADTWNAFGFKVEIKTFDLGTFTSDILASRNFDTAYFGQVTGRDPDPYPFWHSSQKARGANIAQYTNKSVDAKIAELGKTVDPSKRNLLLQEIDAQIAKDIPAVFAFSPLFIYVTDKQVNGIELPMLSTISERFSGIEKWYLSSERIWKFFNKNRTVTDGETRNDINQPE